jgi:2-polyprenyl-3-methyl-5-hydroxy-6-metoxy-1,4-benzoquinol methylase
MVNPDPFAELKQINQRPQPFEFYTAAELWTDEYISRQMLAFHLNEDIEAASRKKEFIDRSVGWILSHFEVKMGTAVADFGCGPGLYTTPLAKSGAKVTGIDFSARSIDYARAWAKRDGLSIRYLRQNYLEFESNEHFDLILLIYCDFCTLSPQQRTALLNKFAELLNPGGALLLDVNSLADFDQCQENASYAPNLLDGFWSAAPYYGFLNTFKYEPEKLVLEKYTIIEVERRRQVYNWHQCFSPDSLAAELSTCGLVCAEKFADVAGAPYSDIEKVFAAVIKKA